jgi:hypothetical protein
MLHGLSPKIRADSAMYHSAPGGLSTVTVLPASMEPKRKAFQFCDMAWTAPE